MLAGMLLLLIAQPEVMGPYAVEEIDAGDVVADGVGIPTKIYAPMTTGRFPVVGVVHGAMRTGRQQEVLARTFASLGYVAVLPSIPCGWLGCDHAANARQLSALLDYAVDQSAAADRIDGERRALVGHSWGGLAVHLATALDPRIDVVVGLDPNDDLGEASDAAPNITVPNAALMAEVGGVCNATDWGNTVHPLTGSPRLRLRMRGAAHCDVEDPGDNLCPIACGSGDPSKTYLFKRYAIAFISCVLDGANGDWIGGASMSADETAGLIDQIDQAGLETLPCRGATPPVDGGAPDEDAGAGAMDAAPEGRDAEALDPDAEAVDQDAASPSQKDAEIAAADAGTDPVNPTKNESGCTSVPGEMHAWTLILALALLLRPSRRRRR